MGKICCKRTKVETKQLGVREWQAGKESDGNMGGKGQKQNEGMFFVGWKETTGPQRKLGHDKSKPQERPKGHPKEFAFARKQKKEEKENDNETQKTFQKV